MLCLCYLIIILWRGCICVFFFFKQKTAYEMRISDWSSDVCSSDLSAGGKIEIDHLAGSRRAARHPGRDVRELLGQHNGGVASAAARDQRAERLGEVAPPGKEVVVDLQQVARRSHDEPPRLVGRIARRIGIGFVLVANLVERGSIAIAHGWTD